MKKEYDFFKALGVSFTTLMASLNLPIYLEYEIAEFVQNLSVKKDIDRSQVVVRLLRKDLEIIEL